MVIKLCHTIVADVAVGCALWPENHASLTEFEAVQLVLVDVQIKHSLGLCKDTGVFLIYLMWIIAVKHLLVEIQ